MPPSFHSTLCLSIALSRLRHPRRSRPPFPFAPFSTIPAASPAPSPLPPPSGSPAVSGAAAASIPHSGAASCADPDLGAGAGSGGGGGVVPEGVLLGVGNPLLDISAVVHHSFLTKWGLRVNNAILAEEKHLPLYQELVSNYNVEYIAGGATQNSIRVAQWMLQRPKATSFMGCIGTDAFAQEMISHCAALGVNAKYMEDKDHPTGTCAVLICDNERSLVANLGAAEHYKVQHLQLPQNWSLVEQAQFFYIAGFFLTVSPSSVATLAHHACSTDKVFCFNLAAPFICHSFTHLLMDTLPYVDVLFGNETEAQALAAALGWQAVPVEEIALRLSQLPKAYAKRCRTVVVTQGKDPTLVAASGQVSAYPVILVPKEELVDTNGAGDSFVGGYLSQLVQGRGVEECVAAGNYAANTVIKHSGCTFPLTPTYVSL